MSHKHHHHDDSCHHGETCESAHHESHECSCCCHQHHHDHEECGDFAKQLLDVADEAWMDLLKEKIKAKIEAHSAEHLNQLAQLVSETNHNRWQMILAKKKGCHDYKEKLKEFFGSKSCCKK